MDKRFENILNNYNENKKRRHKDEKGRDVSIEQMRKGCEGVRKALLEGNGHYCVETRPPSDEESNEDDIWFAFGKKGNPKYGFYVRKVIFLKKGYVKEQKKLLKGLPEDYKTKVVRILAYNAVKLTNVLDQDLRLPKQLKKIKFLEEDIETLKKLDPVVELELVKFNRANIFKKDRLLQFITKLNEHHQKKKQKATQIDFKLTFKSGIKNVKLNADHFIRNSRHYIIEAKKGSNIFDVPGLIEEFELERGALLGNYNFDRKNTHDRHRELMGQNALRNNVHRSSINIVKDLRDCLLPHFKTKEEYPALIELVGRIAYKSGLVPFYFDEDHEDLTDRFPSILKQRVADLLDEEYAY